MEYRPVTSLVQAFWVSGIAMVNPLMVFTLSWGKLKVCSGYQSDSAESRSCFLGLLLGSPGTPFFHSLVLWNCWILCLVFEHVSSCFRLSFLAFQPTCRQLRLWQMPLLFRFSLESWAPQVLGALVDLNSIFCLPNLVRWWQVPGYNFPFGLWASHFELENSLKEKKKRNKQQWI